MRALAIDWSGAASPSVQRKTIWSAHAVDGHLTELSAGRTRADAISAIDLRAHDVIGLDFGFGFPAWWLGCAGQDAWDIAHRDGERWLAECREPFWGRPGHPRPSVDGWRRTELELRSEGWYPGSVFQIGGCGSVGSASVRGMPLLKRLRGDGAAVWPFDPWPTDGRPVVAEVWPRLCTGQVVKSSAAARRAHLDQAWPRLRPALRDLAIRSPDAFDAACAALALSCGVTDPGPADAVDAIEGRILRTTSGSGQPTRPRTIQNRRPCRPGSSPSATR